MNTNKTEKVRDAVLRYPQLIPVYLKDKSMNPKIISGIMGKMLPLRWGIEFECIGSVDGSLHDDEITNKFGLFDFNRDCIGRTETTFNEHRVSGLGYLHLLPLYNILQKMQVNCNACNGSGIHVHIDTSFFGHNMPFEKLHSFFNREIVLDRVYEIFGSQYKGTYNKRGGRIKFKGKWIRITDSTVEFRIGELTFNYEEIVRILIDLQLLVKEAAIECGYKGSFKSTLKKWKSQC